MTETVPTELPVARTCPFAEPAEYERTRDQGPVSRVRLPGGDEVWWISRWQEARAVLADGRFSSDRRREGFPLLFGDKQTRKNFQNQPLSMIGMDGAEHSAARRAVISEFSVKRIAAMRPRIQEIVDGFIDEMLAAGERPVDLVRMLSLPVPSLVICELLGVPYADHDFFQSRTSAMIRRTTAPEERRRCLEEVRGYLDELLGRKMASPGDDLFSRQIARGSFDRGELVSLAFLLLVAGHETTANMISLGVVGLLEHPDQLALITGDPSRTPLAVEELLRYFTIVESATARVATEDVDVAGVTIRAEEGLIVNGLSADWDPAAFENPGTFDVTRGARNHIAFGYGPHQCLGQNLARLELEIVFNTLFRRIPGLRLAGSVDSLALKTDAGIYGLYELPVTW
ncbi:cytochrome P450 [Actinoplanes sp. NPDC051851]|uniref:cytochrome P450 n=1 Tax=Actinoplanes sp. NPDC051851 TaxID=3154753 RepID=UPI0034252031